MTEPAHDTVTVINLISMPAGAVDGFLQGWDATTEPLRDAPGFRGTQLMRALSPEDPYQIVNVARWNSIEQWQTALSAIRPDADQRRAGEAAAIKPQHYFYRVVSETPDPDGHGVGA